MSVLNATEIMELIPNRYPILFMDYVDELVPDESIIATKNVTINEEFFQGHFPGNPVMPGVLIIESLAQAASILILKSPNFSGKTAYLGAINNAKFRQIVRPGDVLKLHVRITKQKHNMGVVETFAMVGEKKVCQADLTFIVSPNAE
ncbi:3-hydroxyacyl-ACP dehydratase FabZ [Pediococcus claussenii]|uniref:3-hydroxyacyl-[acyl-carrier-protein] dehydratase FabZ n=1 Tax=Pediococcus claussenii (strain ATCC BAA-344 / DSM 14800 / JCM 18046 / KCTC 3811 / LMG 21948 / P06) TaxID=701521 RepID=G8PEQ2_PEDCP|nr:3-hydroxyacyl-ACP dehydratase FabZ [Pediococcus claussenii]AEV94432.1 beta-hydroxyacyl-(acyl-carrier-protein) dehydratase FabZ [Pediococcus claussenii ATCC BAA-344]ANZ69651.1 beta-hydroxyacyl-ACP dehydratase [Pediococcus claussenii]ANZ71468.1 beta-hydroxyacyl-ACP dehydratase [Pediococcus claussenii]KRN19864.1 fabZ protein [Pediococcus claussenii]